MDDIYYWIGFGIFYLAAIFGVLFVITFILVQIINRGRKKLPVFEYIFKYAYYQKDFHKWLQENHPESPENKTIEE